MTTNGRTDGRTDAEERALNNGVNENWTLGGRREDGRTEGAKAKLQFFKRPMHRELLLHRCPHHSYITARRRTPVKQTKYNVNAGMKYGSATAEATTKMQLVLAPIISRPPKKHLPAALQGRSHVGQQRVRKEEEEEEAGEEKEGDAHIW